MQAYQPLLLRFSLMKQLIKLKWPKLYLAFIRISACVTENEGTETISWMYILCCLNFYIFGPKTATLHVLNKLTFKIISVSQHNIVSTCTGSI